MPDPRPPSPPIPPPDLPDPSTPSRAPAPQGHAAPHRPARPRARTGLAALLGASLLLALAPLAQAQDPCSSPGMNGQCTEFGAIAMEAQRDIRGEPIDLAASFTLATVYPEQGARWLLVSVRNVEADGSNPVTIDVVRFGSEHGEILTTRVERPGPNEVNLWAETLDVPVGSPITLDLRVGASERGAFRLETLVMAFDRGYAPVKDSLGNDASLFSYTLLGVNEETASVGGGDDGSLLSGNKVPGLGAGALFMALAAVAVLARRRAA